MSTNSISWLLALVSLSPTAQSVTSDRDRHAQMPSRGAQVMGFDQQATVHHFYLYADGGAIDVGVTNTSDVENRDAIRSHLPHIAMMFGAGNFDAPMLVHDSKTVPGTAAMAKLKSEITYEYVETPHGGRVDIMTRNSDALAAIHEFLRFQIREHRTGDATSIRSRRP